jgi:histidinol-phosphate aminotransferase
MTISRRNFFQRCAVGAVSSVPISLRHGLGFPGQLAAHRALESHGLIRLDNNENAYGPSARVKQSMAESLELANRYPDLEYQQLLQTIAALHGTSPDRVVLGCGSSEILRMAATAFLGPGKTLILASPTFELIAADARRLAAEVVAVPLTKQYAHNLSKMLGSVGPSTGLIYICNPNNPTGSLTPRQNLEGFLRDLPAKLPVVIDEAYHHYVGKSSSYASFLDRSVEDDRVIVTRTLSAIYGLAGLRIGYGIAVPKTARLLSAVRLQSDINVVAARAAVAALTDPDYVRIRSQQNANDRQEFLNMANARMLRVIDSHTNFAMLKTGTPGQDMIQHFNKNGILVGPLVPSMPTYIRVSLGTPVEMKEFWRVWDLMPAQKMAM